MALGRSSYADFFFFFFGRGRNCIATESCHGCSVDLKKTLEIDILCSPGNEYFLFGYLRIPAAFQIKIHEDPLKILFLKILRHILTLHRQTLFQAHRWAEQGRKKTLA